MMRVAVLAAAPDGVAALRRCRGHRLLRRQARALAEPRDRPRSAARSARRQDVARRHAGTDVVADARSSAAVAAPGPDDWAVPNTIGPVMSGSHEAWPLVTPFGLVAFPLWVVLIVLGREAFMTVFRQAAATRRRHRGHWAGEVEDRRSSLVWAGCVVLLVLRRDAGRVEMHVTGDVVALLRAGQRHRRHRRRWSARSRSPCTPLSLYVRRYGYVLGTAAREAEPVADSCSRSHGRRDSSPSATSCCSASRSTPTPRTSRGSSPRLACTIVRRATVGDEADEIAAAVERCARSHRRGDHHRRARSHERRSDAPRDRRVVRPRARA